MLFGAEQVSEPINPVAPDIANMFWGAVLFAILLILMYTVCLPPIRRAMRQREEQQRLDAEAAERADQAAEQVRRDYDATLADARAMGARIVDEARAEADAQRQARIAEVEAELAAERQALMTELDAQRSAALSSMTPQVGELATAAASKVVQRTLAVTANQGLVDDFVASATRS